MHITKTKGDIGAAMVLADLISKGIQVCVPVITEHLPFDLIGVFPEGSLKRISVKYRSVDKDGRLFVELESNYYSTKTGPYRKDIDKEAIDMVAVFCPETKEVYYINHKEFNKGITLRVFESKSNQVKNINFAKDYLDVFNLKGKTIIEISLCENCNVEHDGKYGAGRFCSELCARRFSTNKIRKMKK